MKKSVLVIGINPSGHKWRKNCSLDRLQNWMLELGYEHYAFSNVIPYVGDYHLKDVDQDFVKEQVMGHNKIVALGGFVSTVFRRCGIDHFKMPHPSPLNRTLNSKEYETKMLSECREYLEA